MKATVTEGWLNSLGSVGISKVVEGLEAVSELSGGPAGSGVSENRSNSSNTFGSTGGSDTLETFMEMLSSLFTHAEQCKVHIFFLLEDLLFTVVTVQGAADGV